jgi:hypothetical protein
MKQILIILILSVLSACAGSEEARDDGEDRRRDCILQSSIRGYTVLDEQNLIVDASARKKYHVTLSRRAYGLRNSWTIGFYDSSSAGRICSRFSEIVYSDGMTHKSRERIASIRQLTPEEEENLLIRFGLKEPEVTPVPVPQEVKGADIEELDPDAKE